MNVQNDTSVLSLDIGNSECYKIILAHEKILKGEKRSGTFGRMCAFPIILIRIISSQNIKCFMR